MALSYEGMRPRYSVIIEGRQLTYVIEKDGNTIKVNANPLYDFLKEMFTTDWQAELNDTKEENNNGLTING